MRKEVVKRIEMIIKELWPTADVRSMSSPAPPLKLKSARVGSVLKSVVNPLNSLFCATWNCKGCVSIFSFSDLERGQTLERDYMAVAQGLNV